MISFQQFLTEDTKRSPVRDNLLIKRARQALINVGFQAEYASFVQIHRFKQADFEPWTLYANKSQFMISKDIRDIHIIGIKKNFSGSDARNTHAMVYKVNRQGASQDSPLLKLIPAVGVVKEFQPPKTVRIKRKDMASELQQWDILVVCSDLGAEQAAKKAEEEKKKQEQDKAADGKKKAAGEESDQQKQDKAAGEESGQGETGSQRSKDDDSESSTSDSKTKVAVDLGPYANKIRDEVAQVKGYQLIECYVRKTTGRPVVVLKQDGLAQMGNIFVDFKNPIISKGHITFECRTLTLRGVMSAIKQFPMFDKIKGMIGVGTKDTDKFERMAIQVGEAFKDFSYQMERAAKVARILSQLEISKMKKM